MSSIAGGSSTSTHCIATIRPARHCAYMPIENVAIMLHKAKDAFAQLCFKRMPLNRPEST